MPSSSVTQSEGLWSDGRFTLSGGEMEEQHLTMSDVFTLFGRHAEDTRWVASADSQEYLAVVLYLVQRNNAR